MASIEAEKKSLEIRSGMIIAQTPDLAKTSRDDVHFAEYLAEDQPGTLQERLSHHSRQQSVVR